MAACVPLPCCCCFCACSGGGGGSSTWEAARAIYDPGPQSQTIGNLVRVLPNGTLVNLFAQLDNAASQTQGRLMVIRSTDRGATWSAPVRVASLTPVGALDPTTGQAIRDGSIIPQMAVAPGGALYVVWQDARFGGVRDAIAFSRSDDGGLTWSQPTRVNSNITVAAFTPQVHVRADGTIGVTYSGLHGTREQRDHVPAVLYAHHRSAGQPHRCLRRAHRGGHGRIRALTG